MLKNYLKVAMRYLTKHKGYTFINVLGLAVGIATCILIMLFVKSEWSFDRFHSKADRIHRAWLQEHYEGEIFNSTATPIPLSNVLQSNLTEAEKVCRVTDMSTFITHNNNRLNGQFTLVDSTFFDVFDFKLKQGNIDNPFPTSHSIILTEAEAKRIFGKEPAMGKNIQLSVRDSIVLFTVSGIAANPPLESFTQFEMLIPFSNASYIWSEQSRNSAWSNVVVQTFVLLKPNANLPQVHRKIDLAMQPLVAKNYKPGQYLVRLQPLKDIYFNTTLPEEVESASDPKYSYILGTIGILILLIACINFVTLSVGRSVTRALEVGVRKVLGAERRQIMMQYWSEALLLTLLSVIIGVALSMILLKSFNQLANRELVFAFNFFTVAFICLLTILIALLAGIYPSIVLSNFKPIQVLKGKLQVGSLGIFRKALVVGQFVASIVMIIATITVGRQLEYLSTKDLGFNREHVIVVATSLNIAEGRTFAQKYIGELQKNPNIINSTASIYGMHNYGWMTMGFKDDKNVFRQFKFNAIDPDFVNTMDLKIVQGRNFEKGNAADSNYVLVNETFVKEYGWKKPIGEKLPGKYEQTVIGVVKDFNVEALYTSIEPVVMALNPKNIFEKSSDVSYGVSPRPRVSVRFKGGDAQAHLEQLKAAWKSVAGDREFNSAFLDEALAAAYQQEQRLGKIVNYASYLSIFISCLGLFGLATLVVVRRTKEIGIRKVLGADVTSIVRLLSKDFVVLVLVAALIAFPVAWWALSDWLQDFTYRINIPLWVFVVAALLALIVALLTVSFHAVRAALANPVKSLRTE
ncbi:MAG TPA: ABC transporter permease [Segetibacter sp.]